MNKTQFSMNGFRQNLISEMVELKEAIESVFDSLDEDDKEELVDKFDHVACYINSLSHVWIEGDENFSNMSDSPEVPLLGDYD